MRMAAILVGSAMLTTASAIATAQAAQSSAVPFKQLSIPSFDHSSSGGQVGLKDDRHERLTLPVQLSGAGPFDFLVDTGSDRTVIARDVAARLQFTAGRSARLHSVTGESAVSTVRVPNLQFSNRRLSVAEAPVLERSHIGADGILGVDSLQSQRVLFDFKGRTMTLAPSRRAAVRPEDGEILVRARSRYGRLVVTNARAEHVDVVVVVDTGSQVTIANEALRRHLAIRPSGRASGPVELMSVTGASLAGEYAFLKRLKFQGIEMADLVVVFADAHTFRQLGLDKRPALLLGMNAMRAFDKLSIDFASRQLRIQLPERSAIDGAVLVARSGSETIRSGYAGRSGLRDDGRSVNR